jgi:hypothetical protein
LPVNATRSITEYYTKNYDYDFRLSWNSVNKAPFGKGFTTLSPPLAKGDKGGFLR